MDRPTNANSRRRLSGTVTPALEPLEVRTLLSSPYHLTFNDEYNAMPAISHVVGSATPGYLPTEHWQNHFLANNGEKEYYVWPGVESGYNPFSVSGGVLTITAQPTPAGMSTQGQPYVSGMLTTASGANYPQNLRSSTPFSQKYGYFEMRCALPTGKGLWPAFWLMPANGTSSAEYDIFEVLGHETGTVYQSVHYNNYANHGGSSYKGIDSADGYHTYGFLWDANQIRWYVDGVLTQTMPNVSNTPMYVLMNLAVGGYWPGNPDATTLFPATMKIDYLRVYSADPSVPAVTPQAGYDGSLPGAIDTPATPQGVSAVARNSGQIDVAWNAVSGAGSYDLYRSTTASGFGATPYKSALAATSLSDTGLLGGSTFYYKVVASNTLGQSVASATVHATTPAAATSAKVDFSDLNVNDYAAVPANYQPSSLLGTGITMNWTSATRYGANAGGKDHTSSVDVSAASKYISSPTHGSGWTNAGNLGFSAPVKIPSVWVSNTDWWKQDVVLNGYAIATDTLPAVTVTIPYTSIPSHASGNVTGAWVNVTGLANVAIQRLEFVGVKKNSTSQVGGAVIDDLTVEPVVLTPDPGYTVSSLAINDSVEPQRSMVKSLRLTFERAVVLTTNSVQLRQINGAVVPVTIQPSTDGGLSYRMVFPTSDTGASLADGRYVLTVLAAQVFDLQGRTMTGGDRTFEFHRFFGDTDGDGDVDNADLFRFRLAQNTTRTSTAYRNWFDIADDGDVDNADLFQFRLRQNKNVFS